MRSVREINSTCPYCGVGCGVLIATDRERITGVRGDPDHPANFGRFCTKGASLHLTAGAGGRVLFPQLRAARGAPRERVSWGQALDFAADEFTALIREHGPDSVAFDVSDQLLTDLATLQMKLGCGTRCGSCVPELKRLIALRGRKPHEHVASAPRGERSQDERKSLSDRSTAVA